MDKAGFDKSIRYVADRLSKGDKFMAEELRLVMTMAISNLPEYSDYNTMRTAAIAAIDLYIKGKVAATMEEVS